MIFRRFFPALFAFLLLACAQLARSQATPSAYASHLSLNAGGIGSVFQPDYAGGGVPHRSSNALFGVGGYVDVQFSRWFGIEAEGRWLRFNQFVQIHQDNYLLGYRLPIQQLRFGRFTPYGKVMAGYGKMSFEYNGAHGRFTDLAYGGGLDMHTNSRLIIRPVDFEYQQWPNWLGTSLHPWGFSAGVGWRILGR
ncbi:MAG TPA: outer membrane beta-barrel protein [Terracidiphilus sp.]